MDRSREMICAFSHFVSLKNGRNVSRIFGPCRNSSRRKCPDYSLSASVTSPRETLREKIVKKKKNCSKLFDITLIFVGN